MASRNVPESSLEESSPDRLGATLDMADAGTSTPPAPVAPLPKPSPIGEAVVPAAMLTRERGESTKPSSVKPAADQQLASATTPPSENSQSQKLPAGGTVVLDVEEGGIEVPSFLGKNLRIAIEAAQDAGLDLDAIGSGVAREQAPLPGTHVAAGSRITVHFGR
jgi:cell division protein FtsI (penicillin-binding protein 3)